MERETIAHAFAKVAIRLWEQQLCLSRIAMRINLPWLVFITTMLGQNNNIDRTIDFRKDFWHSVGLPM